MDRECSAPRDSPLDVCKVSASANKNVPLRNDSHNKLFNSIQTDELLKERAVHGYSHSIGLIQCNIVGIGLMENDLKT